MSLNLSMLRRLFVDSGPCATDLPAAGIVGVYPPGHLFECTTTGRLFRNVGVKGYSDHSDEFSNRYCLTERFMQRPCLNADLASGTEATREPANNNWEAIGTNTTSAMVAFADGGGVTITTGTAAAADFVALTPHLDTAQSAWAAAKWNTNDRVIFDTVVKTGAALTARIMYAGLKLTNTETIATDNDQAYFRFSSVDSDTTWRLITSRAGTDSNVSSGVTVAVSTSYWLRIQIDGNRKPRFYINGVEVGATDATGGAALTADVDLIPYVGVALTTTTAVIMTCRGVALSKVFND